ncbi:acyloxyacyl hydrolase [Hymenobacter weizhouensis]|uniref:acyloxyacyl hydrolase n=1 Tax=Hymenobacter sp. YIM 151500-1 TaxID=2987689 RepID=UPI002225DB3D|nr:acyloxyacyl hydrolase [Hymenobacter sp. YIM 151500-1]UYZ61758.1 acyloxyacyl hydrolase [Hymenobacter sp. YIM 151500-1]
MTAALGWMPKAQAQQAPPRAPVLVGAQVHGSFIIAHTPAIKHLAVSHPTGFEVNVQRQTNGSQPWHAWYRYPRVGVAFTYYDYHNPTLGRSYAAGIYLSKAVWRRARQEVHARLGSGLAYFPQGFDAATNHRNTIISSRFNAIIQLRAEYDVALTSHWGALLALGLNHYSNGATTKPNFGINLPTVSVGLNYHGQRPWRPLSPPAPGPDPADLGRTRVSLSATAGLKQHGESDPRRYLVNSITVSASRRVGRKSTLTAGVEGFLDRSLTAQLRDTARTTDRLPDVRKAGLYLGHELLFGRFAFVSHLGVYLYNPYKSNNFYYERLGLKYQITEHLFSSLDLKVHRGSADVIECRLGVRL